VRLFFGLFRHKNELGCILQARTSCSTHHVANEKYNISRKTTQIKITDKCIRTLENVFGRFYDFCFDVLLRNGLVKLFSFHILYYYEDIIRLLSKINVSRVTGAMDSIGTQRF